ncbi:TetR/AcrR family transcriptional regulator [Corynebacterium crudilactis]|uniref:TetR family transcriptional regulator n=1 Tax=Corynebacterium crudilactis TaxID=1652495 RepID=A0A172QXH2_9CORY|nr:TetR/AcrR family transcriptional regulator [Corynebacterium crudilactis]ANE05338.1 TetR family transcriptional regulator [Corynebacterium crudilactis]
MRADARKRREHIITTTCELYRTHHHDSLTMDNIAEAAGVGIATLYRNFPDRFALDMACAHYLFTVVISWQEQAINTFPTNPARVWTSFNQTLFDKGLGSLVPALAPESLDELPEDISALRQTTEDNIATLIGLAKEQGLVHANITPGTYILGLITISRPPITALATISTNSHAPLLGLYLSGLKHGAMATSIGKHDEHP